MKTDGLDDAFNVETSIVPAEVEKVQKKEKQNADHISKDYEYTRGNLYSIIEKGQEAINGILELAQESEMPRAYEVAGQLIKNVADATDKLMDLQKKLKDVNEEEKANLLYWQVTCEAFNNPDSWKWWFSHSGYKGDYSFIFFE